MGRGAGQVAQHYPLCWLLLFYFILFILLFYFFKEGFNWKQFKKHQSKAIYPEAQESVVLTITP